MSSGLSALRMTRLSLVGWHPPPNLWGDARFRAA